jgi:hypothetical protein
VKLHVFPLFSQKLQQAISQLERTISAGQLERHEFLHTYLVFADTLVADKQQMLAGLIVADQIPQHDN